MTDRMMVLYLVSKGHAMRRNDQAQMDRIAKYYGYEREGTTYIKGESGCNE